MLLRSSKKFGMFDGVPEDAKSESISVNLKPDAKAIMEAMTNQNTKYRTIAAVPVTNGTEAVGAVSLDASIPYLFHGKASDVAVQLEPYIVLLSMTLNGSEHRVECKYEPSHH